MSKLLPAMSVHCLPSGETANFAPLASVSRCPPTKAIGTGDLPHDRARLAVFRRQTLGAGGDVLHLQRALLPHLAAEVRPVFPQAVADVVRVEELVGRTCTWPASSAPSARRSLRRGEGSSVMVVSSLHARLPWIGSSLTNIAAACSSRVRLSSTRMPIVCVRFTRSWSRANCRSLASVSLSRTGPARIDRQSVWSGASNGGLLHLGTSRCSRVGAPRGVPRARALVPGCVAWPPSG